jgi:hypothetical protein
MSDRSRRRPHGPYEASPITSAAVARKIRSNSATTSRPLPARKRRSSGPAREARAKMSCFSCRACRPRIGAREDASRTGSARRWFEYLRSQPGGFSHVLDFDRAVQQENVRRQVPDQKLRRLPVHAGDVAEIQNDEASGLVLLVLEEFGPTVNVKVSDLTRDL